MQNGNANLAVRVDIRVPHFRFEYHRRWIIRVIVGELKLSFEVAAFIQCVLGPLEDNVPDKEIVIFLESNGRRDVVPLLTILKLLRQHLHRIIPVVACRITIHHFELNLIIFI